MGGEREAAIANMESMGFARADIDRAMRAAFFNPDRAVEYLLTVGQATLLPSRHVLTSFRVFQRVRSKSRHNKHKLVPRPRPHPLKATQVRLHPPGTHLREVMSR
jgi:hypothetical protein